MMKNSLGRKNLNKKVHNKHDGYANEKEIPEWIEKENES